MTRPAKRPEAVREILARAPRCQVCEIPSPDVPLVPVATRMHGEIKVCPSCQAMIQARGYAA